MRFVLGFPGVKVTISAQQYSLLAIFKLRDFRVQTEKHRLNSTGDGATIGKMSPTPATTCSERTAKSGRW